MIPSRTVDAAAPSPYDDLRRSFRDLPWAVGELLVASVVTGRMTRLGALRAGDAIAPLLRASVESSASVGGTLD